MFESNETPPLEERLGQILESLILMTRTPGAGLSAALFLAARVICNRRLSQEMQRKWQTLRDADKNSLRELITKSFLQTNNESFSEILCAEALSVDEFTIKSWAAFVKDIDIGASQGDFHKFAIWISSVIDELETWELRGRLTHSLIVPADVANLMSNLASISPGDTILDPWCGGGGLLASAGLSASERADANFGAFGLRLTGIEQNDAAAALTALRLVLLGFAPDVKTASEARITQDAQYDVVICAPPAGLPVDQEQFAWNADPTLFEGRGRHLAETIITQITLKRLRHGGRAVLLVPTGLLFRRGDDKELRKVLIEQNLVQAVVALPRGILAPLTNVETAIIILRSKQNLTTTFIDAREAGIKDRRGQRLTPGECELIANVLRGNAEPTKTIARAQVGRDQIVSNDFSLNLSAYFEDDADQETRSIEERTIEVAELSERYRTLYEKTNALIRDLKNS